MNRSSQACEWLDLHSDATVQELARVVQQHVLTLGKLHRRVFNPQLLLEHVREG